MASAHLDQRTRAKIVRYLELEWSPYEVANEVSCSVQTVRTIQRNLRACGTALAPRERKIEIRRRIHAAAEQSIREYLARNPRSLQEKLRLLLQKEWEMEMTRRNISLMIRRNRLANALARSRLE